MQLTPSQSLDARHHLFRQFSKDFCKTFFLFSTNLILNPTTMPQCNTRSLRYSLKNFESSASSNRKQFQHFPVVIVVAQDNARPRRLAFS